MPLVITNEFVDGTTAQAAEVNQNFQDVVAKFNAAIVDADISAIAGIKGTKLSSSAPDQVPTAAIADLAITTPKIGPLAVTTAKIGPLAVTTAEIALLAVGSPQMLVGAAAANLIGGNGVITGTMLKITLATAAISLSGVGINPVTQTLTLSGTFPKATYDCYGAYIKNPAGVAYTTDGAVATLYPVDSGTDWALKISAHSGNSGAGAPLTGTAVVVFVSKN